MSEQPRTLASGSPSESQMGLRSTSIPDLTTDDWSMEDQRQLRELPPPISPTTAANTLENFHGNPEAAKIIALGLLATIARRDHQNAVERKRMEAKIRALETEVEQLTPDNPPDGFILNGEDEAPSFTIPIQDGYAQPAYWVKLLPDGRVAGLPQDCKPGDTPFIADIYAERPDLRPHGDESVDPVLPLPPWLQQLLQGPSANWDTLRRAVQEAGNWGLLAEAQRYRMLHHNIQDAEMRMADRNAELRSLRQAKDLCQGRLELSGLVWKVSDLRVLQPDGSRHSRQLGRSNRGGLSREPRFR